MKWQSMKDFCSFSTQEKDMESVSGREGLCWLISRKFDYFYYSVVKWLETFNTGGQGAWLFNKSLT